MKKINVDDSPYWYDEDVIKNISPINAAGEKCFQTKKDHWVLQDSSSKRKIISKEIALAFFLDNGFPIPTVLAPDMAKFEL